MNGKYLSSTELISIRVVLTTHGSSFKRRDLVDSHAKEILKLNNAINMLYIILQDSWSLNTHESLICVIYQQNCNRLKNHKSFHLKTLV